jgi:FkbM family methyltransferase
MQQLNSELKHVVLFEPQKRCIEKLKSLSLPRVEKVVYGCGLGMSEQSSTIKGGTASASVYAAAPIQTHYFPGSIRDESEQIEIKVLDKIYSEDQLPIPDVIKLDVQGYELDVLQGGVDVLAGTKYLVVELSFQRFYEGQPPLWELLKFLEDNHYALIAHGFEWKSPGDPNRMLQVDGIFANTRLVNK